MKFTKSLFKKLAIFIFLITSIQLVFSMEAVTSMFGILKVYDVHLSPEVRGRITHDGKPMAGLEVFRELTYGSDKSIIESMLTDDEGRFSFPEKNIRSRKPGNMLATTPIRQIVDLEYKGERKILWYTTDFDIIPIHGKSQRLEHLNCDLSNSEEVHKFESLELSDHTYMVSSICRW